METGLLALRRPPDQRAAGVAFGFVLAHRTLELSQGKQLQHLAENAGYSNYGGQNPPCDSCLTTQALAEIYRCRANANLDKSDQEG